VLRCVPLIAYAGVLPCCCSQVNAGVQRSRSVVPLEACRVRAAPQQVVRLWRPPQHRRLCAVLLDRHIHRLNASHGCTLLSGHVKSKALVLLQSISSNHQYSSARAHTQHTHAQRTNSTTKRGLAAKRGCLTGAKGACSHHYACRCTSQHPSGSRELPSTSCSASWLPASSPTGSPR